MLSKSTVALMSAAGGASLWGTLGPVASLLTGEERLAAGGIRLAVGVVALLVLSRGRPRIPGVQ